ncbi:piggyBac transposable element-derived protein 4-like [Belonocnema kinseyi]|uniref:piggyBac transposable element-derived protein 4-like n=1 Tax=Belonocnema kinseyi TaxID=2817044 RepID=UPI00143D7B31|nr:piggyBac transposable element-derived protein 4-like [Belonocnema kinseyi]
MSFNKLLYTPEEVDVEFRRQEAESEGEDSKIAEDISETDDETGSITNSDICDDEVTDEYKLFCLFITNDIINKIVRHTNESIEISKNRFTSDQWYIHPTDPTEIRSLIGLFYMSCILKNRGLNLEDMFSPIWGFSVFRCSISKNRLEFLFANIRFDDKNTRDTRKAEDKFTAFREIWSVFEGNCFRYYSPSKYLTIDETLLSFRGRCSFRMYIASKPDKYGLKIESLCDARTFYFISEIPYVGKEKHKKKKDLPLPTQYVLNLTDKVKGSNRNITCDNWFSSLGLVDALLERKLTFVGTLRKNKAEIPPSVLSKASVGSSQFLYQDNKMLR